MPATIFAGSKVKTLKNTLSLNGGADIISSTVDPTSVATDGAPGSLLLNTTSGRLYRKNDSGSSTNWEIVGSGAGGINYVTNPDAESNTTGWSTYADAAGALPVDGAGGTANITWTRSTTSPLRGVADFVLTKDAVNRQGEGVATDLTINLADQAKRIVISLNYEILSGTYADGDIGVYMIADPAGTPVVIQPAGFQMQSLGSGTKGRLVATFQTQATGQAYRLCFHVASTSAAAYTVAIDTVQVGPQNVTFSTPVTDWVSYTPTFNGFGTTTAVEMWWRRVGDSVQVRGRWTNGTTTAAEARVGLPSGLTTDSAKLVSIQKVGDFTQGTSYAAAHDQQVLGEPGATYLTFALESATQAGLTKQNGNFFGNTAVMSVNATVPVTGWSSSAQVVSDSSEGRVVAMHAAGTTTGGTAGNIVIFGSTIIDTVGGYSTSTGRYTVRVPGVYRVSASINATNATGVVLFRNGSAVRWMFATSSAGAGAGSVIISCAAGDLLDVRPNGNLGAFSGGDVSSLSIDLIQGSQTLLGGETVAASATVNATQSVTGTPAAFLYQNELVDTTGSYNPATGVFTVPVAGLYETHAAWAMFATLAQGNVTEIRVTKNGSTDQALGFAAGIGGTADNYVARVHYVDRYVAGDTITIRARCSTSVTAANSAAAQMSIKRIGNY
jgi:hypothetical protein